MASSATVEPDRQGPPEQLTAPAGYEKYHEPHDKKVKDNTLNIDVNTLQYTS